MKYRAKIWQQGLALSSLIFALAIMFVAVVAAVKVVPAAIEYNAVQRAIVAAKTSGNSAREIQDSFDKQVSVYKITSISSRDLEIVQRGGEFDVSFAYQKKYPLFGPVSLVFDYVGSTAKSATQKTIN